MTKSFVFGIRNLSWWRQRHCQQEKKGKAMEHKTPRCKGQRHGSQSGRFTEEDLAGHLLAGKESSLHGWIEHVL